MPYKRGKKWQAMVMFEGERYYQLFDTKKEAKDWEAETRKNPKIQTAMAFSVLSNKYLDNVRERFTKKVYIEKKTIINRFLVFSEKTGRQMKSPFKISIIIYGSKKRAKRHCGQQEPKTSSRQAVNGARKDPNRFP